MNKILALHVGHDATAMFINEKEFIAISEERVSRIKIIMVFHYKL